MCGIVAIVSDERPVDLERIDRALGAMTSRGPDGTGSWRAPDGWVALGHTRLAVRGIHDGAQPIESEDGTIVAVVNGEIYGARELRRELERKGHRFRGRSDSELVVHLYEERGDEMIADLRGELAFIVVDRRRRRVFAARDRYGIKPLVFARAPFGWVLASSARALFAAGLAPRLDEDALFVASSLQYLPWDRTLFDGVASLPPGHALVIERGEQRMHAWTPAAPADHDGFAPRFERAVRDRLEAEVPIAFQLSGGIDSAAVLAIAARYLRPRAFTVSFPGRPEDELAPASAIAAHVGADLEVVPATPDALADAWPEAARDGEGLAINAHLPAKWLLARAIRGAGAAVALTGEGADEILYGYPHLAVDAGFPIDAAHHRASLGVMLPDGVASLDNVERRLGFVPTFLRAKACIGARVTPLFRGSFAERFAGVDPAAALLEGVVPDPAPVDTAARLWSRLALAGYILRTLGDGMDMAHGIEGRLPYLDGALTGFLDGVGWGEKIGKAPLRSAMRGILPEAVVVRNKHPFIAPPMEGAVYRVAADALSGARFASQSVFEPSRAMALLGRARAGDDALKKRLDPALWLVATLALVMEGLRISS